jgi:hypothetical protein
LFRRHWSNYANRPVTEQGEMPKFLAHSESSLAASGDEMSCRLENLTIFPEG